MLREEQGCCTKRGREAGADDRVRRDQVTGLEPVTHDVRCLRKNDCEEADYGRDCDLLDWAGAN